MTIRRGNTLPIHLQNEQDKLPLRKVVRVAVFFILHKINLIVEQIFDYSQIIDNAWILFIVIKIYMYVVCIEIVMRLNPIRWTERAIHCGKKTNWP